MSHLEPGDAHDELRERQAAGRDCACKHWDAHECFAARYPNRQGWEDDFCECVCHESGDLDWEDDCPHCEGAGCHECDGSGLYE